MDLKGLTIAFLGDSITEGVGASSPQKRFPDILKEKCGLKEVINYGLRGTRISKQTVTFQEYEEWDRDFISRVDEMRTDADCVVVFGGTNDYDHGDAPLGCFGDKDEHSFYGALHILMQKLIERYPDKLIIFMTPLHRINDQNPETVYVPKGYYLSEYVDAIKKVADKYSIPVLDLYAISGINPCIEAQNKLFFADGVHPNDNGYMRIAQRLESFLKAL